MIPAVSRFRRPEFEFAWSVPARLRLLFPVSPGGAAQLVKVGADIEAVCGRCGEVWHVIVAIAGGEIARVECKQCGRAHRYRKVGGRAAPAGTAKRHRKANAKPPAPLVEVDLSRPLKIYRSTDCYSLGDRIDHPRFGAGVVDRVAGPEKIQVFFPDGHRVLVHARNSRQP
jgi:hypothetical protein